MSKVSFNYKPKYFVESSSVLNSLKEHLLVDGYQIVVDLIESNPSYFIDKLTGEKYLDLFTCFASLPLGLNHPKMLDKDFLEYLKYVAINKPSNSDIYTEEMATFVNTFFKIAVPNYFKYAFFIEGGALAVENALKAAFDWKVRKNFMKGNSTEKGSKIIHFREAFHGRSGYTMSLTNTDPNKIKYYPKFTDWPRIVNPKMNFPFEKDNFEQTLRLEKQAEEEIKKAFLENPDDIAAIIIEPIQGEGGDNHFRPEFLQKLRQLADENDCLLIFDEIQTGVGITGTMWAHEQMDVHPDIMVFGKKMQVCGILAGGKIDEVPENVFHTSSRINSTWGGNLVDMVRATRYLEIIEEDNLLENVRVMGNYLIEKLIGLEKDYPNLISNVRGRGLFCAFDLPSNEIRNKFRDIAFNQGLLILGSGVKSIRFRPSLCITQSEIDKGIAIIKRILDKIVSENK
ncbi:MAG: L-lysine 6-transaminase [Ignavibacteria bacterium]|nr:L-lysine 6-transaminase [Ignavibacteria bacterium]